MVTEHLTAVALPAAPTGDAGAHVAVFIGPDLAPDGAESPLDDFPHLRRWAALLRTDVTITLTDQAGQIAAHPRLDPIDTALWDAYLPPDTPVRGRAAPDWSHRYWRTFPARELHDAAKLLHAMAMFSDPTTPPAPSLHPLGRLLGRLGVHDQGDRRGYDESRFTAQFDRALGEWPSRRWMPLAELESMLDGQDDPLARLALQLHRARRFYERPEAQAVYAERPSPGASIPPPPRPDPDFHERCALTGDHPAIQRGLGLVIDLEVDDPDRLRSSRWLAARVVPVGDETVCRSPRTRVETVGDELVTVARGPDWHRGQLRLGDTGRYAVLDVDPDGSALKLDRFLWSLPRMLAVERNGDPISAAPAALRSIGFTLVQRRRAVATQAHVDHQLQLAGTLVGGGPVELATEDVTQGLRVDVWDEEAGAWFSLHRRRIDARIHGGDVVAEDLAEEGFIEGATATQTPVVEDAPVHVHESVFGWDGWSLAAPRPGNRVRHEAGEEIVEDPDTDPGDPITPLLIRNRVEPGTLPRLRYGRSYAFRAWAVDLAGGSRDRHLGPAAEPPAAVLAAVDVAVAATTPSQVGSTDLGPLLRSTTAAAALERELVAQQVRGTPDAVEGLRRLREAQLDDAVLTRLRSRRGESVGRQRSDGVTATRAGLVARRFTDAITDEAVPFVDATATLDPRVVARTLDPRVRPDDVTAAVPTVTPLRPFLRWHPVEPPALVPRHAYGAGESLRHVVVRSGVSQDPTTLAITITPPETYGPAHEQLRYRATAERHLAPPKTSQSEAELHGAFDDAIGSTDPADHARALAIAARESGTFFDLEVHRLDDVTVSDPQPGIELAHDPDVPPSVLAQRSLPLTPGEAPVPCQYVVHDVEHLRLPYLPDRIARGISLVFPEAGRDRDIGFPFGTEGFTARYGGAWPQIAPFRLVLAGGDQLRGDLDDGVLTLALPPGDVQRFRLSSALDRDDLDVLGPWRMLPAPVRDDEDVADAAADGWLWALTPFDEITLVHAVPRPLEVPRPTLLRALRPGEGTTDVAFVGAVDVHGPSTEQLSAVVAWLDPVDDLSLPAPQDRPSDGIAFTTPVRAEEDLAVLSAVAEDQRVELPGAGPVWIHRAVHHLGDTRHHTVHVRFRASTRFREYFDAEALAPGPRSEDGVVDDGQSVVGPRVTVSVPSSARPAPPIVHSVLPLFRWDEETEPEQPVAVRRRRRAGLRIYLERPWYSSGEGELLGVLVAPGGNDAELDGVVSQWGADPVWVGAPVANRAMGVELDSLLRVAGLDDRPGHAHPVVPPATLPLTASPGWPQVTVLGYAPAFNTGRGLWCVDVAIDPGPRAWPFVRLAVARYQPDSLPGCHLSAPVRCDFAQLIPERTTSVARTGTREVRIVVSGPLGVRQVPAGASFPAPVEELRAAADPHHEVIARLQRRDPDLPTDLGWETVNATELIVRGHGATTYEAAWVGTLRAPVEIPLRRPGDDPDWRVTVEEWERLQGDPADLGAGGRRPPGLWEQRLVYADELQL